MTSQSMNMARSIANHIVALTTGRIARGRYLRTSGRAIVTLGLGGAPSAERADVGGRYGAWVRRPWWLRMRRDVQNDERDRKTARCVKRKEDTGNSDVFIGKVLAKIYRYYSADLMGAGTAKYFYDMTSKHREVKVRPDSYPGRDLRVLHAQETRWFAVYSCTATLSFATSSCAINDGGGLVAAKRYYSSPNLASAASAPRCRATSLWALGEIRPGWPGLRRNRQSHRSS